MKRNATALLSTILILGGLQIVPGFFTPVSAISIGCSKAQTDARKLSASFEKNKRLESDLYSKARYQDAYRAFYNAQISFRKLYDTVLKSPKCFKVNQRSALTKDYGRFYKQIGACELYGIQICSRWIKPQSVQPCLEYKLARDYQDCIEDHARPTYGD